MQQARKFKVKKLSSYCITLYLTMITVMRSGMGNCATVEYIDKKLKKGTKNTNKHKNCSMLFVNKIK